MLVQLDIGPSWVAKGLHDAAQPREHGQSAVLQFLDLQLFQVTRFGQGQRVESATRGDIPDREFVKDRVNHASSVRFCTANQDGFDDQNVPEGRVARAFRRQRGDGARELVRDGGAVIRGAQGTRGEPRMSVPFSAVQAPVTPTWPICRG